MSGIFPLLFSNRGAWGVTVTLESKTVDKGDSCTQEVSGWQNATAQHLPKTDKVAKCTPLFNDLLRGSMSDNVDKNGDTSTKNDGLVLEELICESSPVERRWVAGAWFCRVKPLLRSLTRQDTPPAQPSGVQVGKKGGTAETKFVRGTRKESQLDLDKTHGLQVGRTSLKLSVFRAPPNAGMPPWLPL